jgi:hypothetical protein
MKVDRTPLHAAVAMGATVAATLVLLLVIAGFAHVQSTGEVPVMEIAND